MNLVLDFLGILLCCDKPLDVAVARHGSIALGETCMRRCYSSWPHSAQYSNDFCKSSNTQNSVERHTYFLAFVCLLPYLRCTSKTPHSVAATRHSMQPLQHQTMHESELCIYQPSRSPSLLGLVAPGSPQHRSPNCSAALQWAVLPLPQQPQAPTASCQEASLWPRPALNQINDKDSLRGYLLGRQVLGAAAYQHSGLPASDLCRLTLSRAQGIGNIEDTDMPRRRCAHSPMEDHGTLHVKGEQVLLRGRRA